MSESLPRRADLAWLKKRAKKELAALREREPAARLAKAQLAVARAYGFASWRALKHHVEALRRGPTTPPAIPETIVSPFLHAVGVGEHDAVAAMLEARPDLVHAVGPHPFWGGRPQALHVALDTGRHDMVLRLLRAGADVDGINDGYSHWSPLLLAIHRKRHASRKALRRRGAKVGLAEALALGDDATVDKLLRRGGLPSNVPNDGSWLALARTPAAVDRLLALGASTDTPDRWGATPMEALSRLGARGKTVVRHLRARGVPTSPEVFARLGDRKTLATLVADDPSIVEDPRVLEAAVGFGHRGLVTWLLDRGADVDARGSTAARATGLHSAAWNGDLAMVELLLQRGADPTLRDAEHDNTPAGWAEVAVDVTNNETCHDVARRLRLAERTWRR